MGNLSIGNKLLLIALLPMVALFYFLAESALEDLNIRKRLQVVYITVLEMEAVSDVLHHVVKERGHSIAYLVTEGENEEADLLAQRVETDQAISSLKRLRKKLGKDTAYASLDRLAWIRKDVDDALGR